MLLIVLCFAEAGSFFDRPGGAYVYTRTAFGEFVGFEVGWMTWLARVASVASLSAGFAQALTGIWPEAGAGWGAALRDRRCRSSLLTGINVVGVKAGARTAVVLVVGKLLPLLFLIASACSRSTGSDLPSAHDAETQATSARRRCCSSSPTPASRTRPRRPASSETPARRPVRAARDDRAA